MSSLHTVSQSPQTRLLESCLAAVADGDAILFIEDGVYHCTRQDLLKEIPTEIDCYGLKEDIGARGLQLGDDSAIQTVSYRKFVELCAQYDKVISWF